MLVLAVGACGPSGGSDTSNGGSESGDTNADSSSSEAGTTPLEDGGCPSDVELLAEAPQGEATENVDPSTLDDDPRFYDEFCDARCPPAPAGGYQLSFCEPTDDADVIPTDPTSDATTDAPGDTTTSESSGSEGDGSTTAGGTSDTGLPEDDLVIGIRCYYWPGCM
ncbi:MAG TPA: hypothetical protein VG755_18080 [Nannocystaceae bacterium]|nr:hypothetical protein [Nannocystaceae bacterium]